MTTRRSSLRSQAVRPAIEGLEGRQLLSSQVSGVDPQGDKWTLTLYGPGTLNVSDTSGNTIQPNVPAEIGTITVAGTQTQSSKLVGLVTPGPGGDGQVFFQKLLEIGGGALPKLDANDVEHQETVANGMLAIDMPSFWLGHTSTTAPTSGTPAGSIVIPDGVISLRFGGVNTDFTPQGGTPLNQNGQSDQFTVDLGLPSEIGTSVVVDKVITDAQAGTTTSTGVVGNPTQDSVLFTIEGRLNLFQANEIDGNSAFAPDQFATTTPPPGTNTVAGGTIIQSTDTGAITGAVGDIRIGGNTTNFTVLGAAQTTDQAVVGSNSNRMSNFSIGGETQNVILLSDGGTRNVFFGKGMDNVFINSYVINHLQANRDALNSTITVDRGIQQVQIGGDVVGTNVQSGYAQNFDAIASSVLQGQPMPTITNRTQVGTTGVFVPLAQNGGQMNVFIAGDVTNSVFSASVEPNPSYTASTMPGTIEQPTSKVFPFGAPNNIIFPRAFIHAKVEGTVDNSNNPLVSTSVPATTAFFAKNVRVSQGPVIPPNIPQAPYRPRLLPPRAAGLHVTSRVTGGTPSAVLDSVEHAHEPLPGSVAAGGPRPTPIGVSILQSEIAARRAAHSQSGG